MNRSRLRVLRGDDGYWYIEGDEGIDVIRGPYATRESARAALARARGK